MRFNLELMQILNSPSYLEYFCCVPLEVVGSAFKPDDLSLSLFPVDLDEHFGVGAGEHHISCNYHDLVVYHWEMRFDENEKTCKTPVSKKFTEL